jgi:hypothetical protein
MRKVIERATGGGFLAADCLNVARLLFQNDREPH